MSKGQLCETECWQNSGGMCQCPGACGICHLGGRKTLREPYDCTIELRYDEHKCSVCDLCHSGEGGEIYCEMNVSDVDTCSSFWLREDLRTEKFKKQSADERIHGERKGIHKPKTCKYGHLEHDFKIDTWMGKAPPMRPQCLNCPDGRLTLDWQPCDDWDFLKTLDIWNINNAKDDIVMKPYGKELIVDLHHCDPTTFTRESIEQYFKELCDLIDMERCELYWWDDYNVPIEEQQTEPHLKGTSAIQFILTSNITIHTLDLMGNVYLNIFSCKYFDEGIAMKFSQEWFKGTIAHSVVVDRM